jgi:hypothetical protein
MHGDRGAFCPPHFGIQSGNGHFSDDIVRFLLVRMVDDLPIRLVLQHGFGGRWPVARKRHLARVDFQTAGEIDRRLNLGHVLSMRPQENMRSVFVQTRFEARVVLEEE